MDNQKRAEIIREAAKACYRLSHGTWEQPNDNPLEPGKHFLIELQIREVIETFLHDQRVQAKLDRINEIKAIVKRDVKAVDAR